MMFAAFPDSITSGIALPAREISLRCGDWSRSTGAGAERAAAAAARAVTAAAAHRTTARAEGEPAARRDRREWRVAWVSVSREATACRLTALPKTRLRHP